MYYYLSGKLDFSHIFANTIYCTFFIQHISPLFFQSQYNALNSIFFPRRELCLIFICARMLSSLRQMCSELNCWTYNNCFSYRTIITYI